MSNNNNRYFISRNSMNDVYQLWALDLASPSLLRAIPTSVGGIMPKGDQLMQVGNYLLQWSGLTEADQYSYRLLEFNPEAPIPLGSKDPQTGKWTEKALQAGSWKKGKFFGSRADFANPQGATKGFESGTELVLVSMHNFVLNWIPTEGRGTHRLFNFDHGSADPLPPAVTQQGAWINIELGHQLMYSCGYVIDWTMATGDFSIWQFDAQDESSLSFPAANSGSWAALGITKEHSLVALGSLILDWEPATRKYRLWSFDPKDPQALSGPLKSGVLPDEITVYSNFTSIETMVPVDAKAAALPGTMDFMRDKIEHVVYYILENRSFDHALGWLYDQNAPIKVIGPEGPYRGVDPKFTNRYDKKDVPITEYNDGKLSMKTKDGKPFLLDLDQQDPYHDYSDVMRQMFSKDVNDYYRRKTPDMGGFALNNGTAEVMMGYSPEQLPVLNGLAKHFAVSDDFFCGMPGGTDTNRAFALTGSSLGMLNNFQNGYLYTGWPQRAHRPSIWKILWSNGVNDFKIYNAVEWINCKFTYNLFLNGQIPSIDDPFVVGSYCPQLNQFFDDCQYDTLPKFSFLEPKWVASAGSTSYHPGNDLIPGERELNTIFNALQASPAWEKTLLVITFDEHGGIADHVPPPYCVNPFGNDNLEGFNFEIMGPRVPTILVSPWIKENTVFRSETGTAYDSTSILATLLQWLGVPKSRWGLGDRVDQAPTFEAVICENQARSEKIDLPLPWDSKFPMDENGQPGKVDGDLPIHGLHHLVVPRMIAELAPQLSSAERARITEQILNAGTLAGMHGLLTDLHESQQ